MLITRVPLEVLIASDPQHLYLPSGSSFLGILQQDIKAKIKKLEEWETINRGERGDYTFKHHAVILKDTIYPIIEKTMKNSRADVGLVEHAREIRLECNLYFVEMFEQEKIRRFYGTFHPEVSLYLVTPLLKQRKEECAYVKSA